MCVINNVPTNVIVKISMSLKVKIIKQTGLTYSHYSPCSLAYCNYEPIIKVRGSLNIHIDFTTHTK